MDRDDPVPEADAIEQEQSVVEERTIQPSAERGEVPEADWLEQAMVEPYDDEDR